VGAPTCHHISFLYSVLRFASQLYFLCLHTNHWYLKLGSSLVTGIWVDGKLMHFTGIYVMFLYYALQPKAYCAI